MKLTIESAELTEPCLVLVLVLPQRVEPKRAPRRVIETTGEEALPDTVRPGLRKVAPVREPLRLVVSK